MGTNIAALIRALLVQYGNMDYAQAEKIAQTIEADQLVTADWLVLSDGTTFDKGYTPHNEG